MSLLCVVNLGGASGCFSPIGLSVCATLKNTTTRMAPHNPFLQEKRWIFDDCWECWWCRRNSCDCLHHIVGRGSGDSMCESSLFNAAPLCNQRCHLPNHGILCTDENIRKLLDKTYSFLMKRNYSISDLDVQFLEKYSKYYIPTLQQHEESSFHQEQQP